MGIVKMLNSIISVLGFSLIEEWVCFFFFCFEHLPREWPSNAFFEIFTLDLCVRERWSAFSSVFVHVPFGPFLCFGKSSFCDPNYRASLLWMNERILALCGSVPCCEVTMYGSQTLHVQLPGRNSQSLFLIQSCSYHESTACWIFRPPGKLPFFMK